MRCLPDTSLENKTVALRVDLNVPVRDGSVLDDSRIIAIMPTLEYILERGGKVLLLSHFGRPTAGSFESQYSLAPIASHLSAALNLDVKLFPTIADVNFDSKVSLLENVRFLAGELENELELSKKLASLADVYIFDAFGTAHRKQASTFGAIEQSAVSCGGLLLEKEMGALNQAISSNALPSLAIVGGSTATCETYSSLAWVPRREDGPRCFRMDSMVALSLPVVSRWAACSRRLKAIETTSSMPSALSALTRTIGA